ncbi:MAG: succinate dehydrogenase, cytochrome b556 subunit [Acidiferrobacterales bacterium]
METVKKRPVYLNLFKIRLPIGGMVSITHRVTGVILVLFLPFLVYFLQLSLQSATGFERTVATLSSSFGKFAVLVIVWISAQHLFSGIRHLLLDIHVAVDRDAARRTAWLTWIGSVFAVLLAAGWFL